MLCCPEVGILCIALERKEVSKMAQYVVDMQMEKQEKFYFIREKESMDIVLLPSKYLMHKKRSRISPNTIRRSAFALSYYLNYMDENQLHLDDVYQMKYAEQHEHFTDFLIWLKAGEHSREEYSKLPNNETCNAYLKEVFRFYTFMERENGQSESLKVLSDAQTIVRNSVGVRRVLNRKSFHGYLKEKGHQGKTIEQDKIVSLLQECANCRDQVLLLLLAETGFRIGELLGVRYGEDIDYKNHVIYVNFREDNENTDAVQFMYRFYNKVRKLGFSKELLETYIQTKRQKEYYDIEEVDKTSAKVRDSSKTKQDRRSNNESISYEEFFEEELELEKQKIESPNNRKQKTGDFQIGIKNGRRNSRREVQRNERNRDEKNKNQSNRNQKNKDLNNRSKSQSNENNYLIVCNGLKIISVICTFLAVILEGIFVFYGMRSGFTRQLFQYSVGGMLLIIVFACGFIWSAQTVRKIEQKNKSNSMNSIKDNINKQNKVRHRKRGEQGSPISDKFIQEKELQDRPQMIKTEVDWEAEGDWESGTEGTTILNYGNESEKEDGKICHPMLRDMELGIIYVIKNCPFYIGSAEGVNHLHIQDKTVSREHAVILEDIYEGDGQGYILRDMGSTNGTWLNGKKIKRGNQEQLEDGAVIRFAKKEYEFLIQDI